MLALVGLWCVVVALGVGGVFGRLLVSFFTLGSVGLDAEYVASRSRFQSRLRWPFAVACVPPLALPVHLCRRWLPLRDAGR